MIRLSMDRFETAVEDLSLLLEELGERSIGTLFRCRVSVRLVPIEMGKDFDWRGRYELE